MREFNIMVWLFAEVIPDQAKAVAAILIMAIMPKYKVILREIFILYFLHVKVSSARL